MVEREKLEREIHQLTQIIGSDAWALACKSTPSADRAGLQSKSRYAPPCGMAC
jgi:hypothetical protein